MVFLLWKKPVFPDGKTTPLRKHRSGHEVKILQKSKQSIVAKSWNVIVPVGFVARSPFALLVKAESPIRSIDDFIAQSKAAPGKVSLGNEGPRTFSGMIARLFNARTSAAANLVAYASVVIAAVQVRRMEINYGTD